MNAKTNKDRVVTLDDESETPPALPVVESEVTEVVGKNFDDQLCGDKVKIEIYESEQPGGKDDVFIQINGYAYKIRRGVEVLIPVEVLHVIENANQTVYEAVQGGGQSERKVKRFAYSVLGSVQKAK